MTEAILHHGIQRGVARGELDVNSKGRAPRRLGVAQRVELFEEAAIAHRSLVEVRAAG